jgi:integrase/recombinase XerD
MLMLLTAPLVLVIAILLDGLTDNATESDVGIVLGSKVMPAGRVGYLQFNAGAVIKAHAEARSVAQRIVSEVEIGLLVRAAPSRRDRILIELGYAGGLRVSELVALIWTDVIERNGGKVQLSVLGKGHKRREVLLPEVVARSLLSLRGDAALLIQCSPRRVPAISPSAPSTIC